MPHGDVKIQWSKRGEAVCRGLDFPVIYALVGTLFAQDALKKLLFTMRKPHPLAKGQEIAAALAREHALPGDSDFLLLWALKHDLLELV